MTFRWRQWRRLFHTTVGAAASITLAAGTVLVTSTGAQAAQDDLTGNTADKIRPELQKSLEENGAAAFWIRFKDRADLTAASQVDNWVDRGEAVAATLRKTAERSQPDVVAALDRAGVSYQAFWATNAIFVRAGPATLAEQIAARPEVQGLYAPVKYELVEPTPGEREHTINAIEWNIANINADDVWTEFGVRGEGITVASIDTGTQFDHPALVDTYRGNLGNGSFDHNYNWFDASGACGDTPCDNNGHGTHTMGTMVGDDGGENQIGVAPEANWITANGCCPSDAALIASGEWMLEPTDLDGANPDASKRPHVVNNSWGTQQPSTDPFMEDILIAWDAAGIVGIWANGNSGGLGCNSSGSPGSRIINYSAGAYDINNNIAGFSGRGPGQDGELKPNISAPGVNVRSSFPGDSYASLQGTSMAAPHVAGALALLWSAAPALLGDTAGTKALFDETAVDKEDLQCGGTADDNNVYGEGRLDALALLQAAPIGDTGTLAGTVSDAGTGEPISGASISITGPADRELVTGADGTYSVLLPVGDYTVTVSAFGYDTQTVTVTIVTGETTTQNFPLETSPSVTVSGQVLDGSGHGWPMYAKISVAEAPATVFDYTNPLNGRYSLTLPANATYTFVAESEYPGYADTTEMVEVGGGSATVNLTMVVDSCEEAPGYDFDGDIAVLGDVNGEIGAFLEGRGIPSTGVSWNDDLTGYDSIIVHRPGNPGQAVFLDFLAATDASGTGLLFLDNWTSGSGVWLLWQHVGNPSSRSTAFLSTIPYLYYEVAQEHPILDGFAVGDEIVFDETSQFKTHAWFGGYTGEGRQVIANAGRADTGVVGPGIGVQERTNNRHALLSLHAVESWVTPDNWTADGAQLFVNALEWITPDVSFDCVVLDGGLVIGNVRDRNTNAGVNGATVASVDNPDETATTVATPEDTQRADGSYALFSSLTGNHRFSASAGNYTDQTRRADVEPNWATQLNFRLAAGMLTVSPSSVEAEVRLGRSADRTFTITNEGTAPAEVELSERPGSFEILRADGTRITEQQLLAAEGAPVRRIDGSFTPAAQPSGPSPAPPANQGPSAPPWTNLPNYPRLIMDNSMAVLDGQAYSMGGTAGAGALADAFAFDPAAQAWSEIADLPEARQKAAVAEIGGLIYVAGGWGPTGNPSTGPTLVYDPSSDSWSEGAAMPASRAAPGTAVLDGQLYAVGGCTSGACATSTSVQRYDPASDSWETLANYPEQTAWLACAGLEGQVFCAGGTDGGGTSTSTYAYDPGTDAWTQMADLPYDNWAMAYAAANGTLLLSGGVTNGFATVTNEGTVYDPGSNTWSDLPASNTTVYRAGSACGFYKAGGSTGGFTPQNTAELLPGFDECAADANVPWLTVDPITATLQPGDSVVVTASMDANVTQPGTYTAAIAIAENTPYRVDPVGVTMNVTPPTTWGKIAGTVEGIACDTARAPLGGAIVQIYSWASDITLITEADGTYAHWLDRRNNPLTMIVAKDGYKPQTRTTRIKAGETTTEDYALQRIC